MLQPPLSSWFFLELLGTFRSLQRVSCDSYKILKLSVTLWSAELPEALGAILDSGAQLSATGYPNGTKAMLRLVVLEDDSGPAAVPIYFHCDSGTRVCRIAKCSTHCGAARFVQLASRQ